MYERLGQHDLSRFGFNASKFKKVLGGKEWQGPCPRCGGKDRMVVSNGMFWCRQCNYSGSLVNLIDNPPTVEEIKKAEDEYNRRKAIEEKQRAKEKSKNIQILNKNKYWIDFHKNLLNRPDRLQQLELDGITRLAVEKFQIGLITKFPYWINGEKHIDEALSFPVFWGDLCYNIRCRILKEDIEGDKYRPYYMGMGGAFYLADFVDMDWAVIVEGEKKAIVCWLNGIPAVGISGCYAFKEKWIPFFKERYRSMYIMLDPDEGGNKGAIRLGEMIHVPVIHIEDKPDDMFNDGRLTMKKMIEILAKSNYERK